MKFFKWKTFFETSVICLLPILLGVALWEKLPGEIAIHFDINNRPDNFASKGFAVFGLPVLMVLFQFICCFSVDFNSRKYGESKKFERVGKWIIPGITVILQIATLGFALGWNVDIRKVACGIVGVMFLFMGNYLPKLNYIKNYNLPKEDARKVNRFMGFGFVVLGILFLASIFLSPAFSLACLFLLALFALTSIIYTIRVVRGKND